MLPLQSPLEAYRADLSRHPNRTDFGRSDTVWLLVAHCLHRLSRAQREARRSIAENCASAIGDLASTITPDTPDECEMLSELDRLRDGLRSIDQTDAAGAVVASARVLADQMGEAGALWLMFSTLGHARLACAAAPAREIGLAMADQAWVARTIGEMNSAHELYDEVMNLGARAGVAELEARALLGKGVCARVRGNYPDARRQFCAGLARAESAGLGDLAAIGHEGLLLAAASARDFDTALAHGWAAYELAAGNDSRQAEIMINLSQVSLDSGHARAARGGFLSTLCRTDAPRFRLPCLAGAALASAMLGERERLTLVAQAAEDNLAPSTLPFETASALKSLYEAFGIVGDAVRADQYRIRARAIARKNGFFEVALATEPREERKVSARPTRGARLSGESKYVIESLESLEADPLAATLALTP